MSKLKQNTQTLSSKYHYGMSKEKYAEQPINNPKNSFKPAQNPRNATMQVFSKHVPSIKTFYQSSASLEFVELVGLNYRVGFSNSIPANRLVIKRAIMLVRIAVHCTKKVSTFAGETC